MPDPNQPSPRRLGRAGIYIVAIVLAVFVFIFFARNIWHGEELNEDQATGQNLSNAHAEPAYDTN
ncbi:hypothetical protein [Sphingomonas sanxanigenens]|uniref:Uncharacterized protein n=1 Tax=Sphingomonas sanxanigenens DSM 19645 = NX02 TaxID=1123269 RepID=W0AKS4_9SPHN|nr:hypothetical protein [Sphingomonas sanxanigenens]AHE57162.1 hypothetical protein NX02_27895 [Sphingomonas sanxanigenens DSM 19645 = NX02]